MTERKDIGARLENWAEHFRDMKLRAHGKSPTAVYCDALQEAALGNLYDRENGIDIKETPDSVDATRIERGMRFLTKEFRLILYWTYVEMAREDIVRRACGLRNRPVSEFVERFRAAQEAIEDIVDGGNR